MEKYKHADILGKPLSNGDPVAFSDGKFLQIGFIVKLNPKMVTISPCKEKKYGRSDYLRYSKDTILLDKGAVTMYLLKL